jgi:hypothetical protein
MVNKLISFARFMRLCYLEAWVVAGNTGSLRWGGLSSIVDMGGGAVFLQWPVGSIWSSLNQPIQLAVTMVRMLSLLQWLPGVSWCSSGSGLVILCLIVCPGVIGWVTGSAGPLQYDNISGDWDGWECDVQIKSGSWKELLFGYLSWRDFLQILHGDGRILLKIIQEKYCGRISIRFIWLRTGTSFGPFWTKPWNLGFFEIWGIMLAMEKTAQKAL